MIKKIKSNQNQHHHQMAANNESSNITPLASQLIERVKTFYFKPPQRNLRGGFSGYIHPSEGVYDRIRFQATDLDNEPMCSAPFGVSEPYDKNNPQAMESNKRNFELAMYSDKLKEFIRELDRVTLETAVKNYDAWFNNVEKKKKIPTEDEIRALYRPLYEEGDREKGFADKFRTKVIIEGEGKLRVFVYVGKDKNGQVSLREGTIADIQKFSKVVPIIEVVGLWFMTRQFGLSLTTRDVVVYPRDNISSAFNFGGRPPSIVSSYMADSDIHPPGEAYYSASSQSASQGAQQSASQSASQSVPSQYSSSSQKPPQVAPQGPSSSSAMVDGQ